MNELEALMALLEEVRGMRQEMKSLSKSINRLVDSMEVKI